MLGRKLMYIQNGTISIPSFTDETIPLSYQTTPEFLDGYCIWLTTVDKIFNHNQHRCVPDITQEYLKTLLCTMEDCPVYIEVF